MFLLCEGVFFEGYYMILRLMLLYGPMYWSWEGVNSNWRGRVCTSFFRIQKKRYWIVLEFFFDVIFFDMLDFLRLFFAIFLFM